MLKQLTNFFGSERQVGEIIAADIERYKLQRRKEVSGSTVNRELALLPKNSTPWKGMKRNSRSSLAKKSRS